MGGKQTALIDYFKRKTTDKLTAAFKPSVDKSINEVGVTHQYKDLVGCFQAIPFAKAGAFDLDYLITDKSLTGLFYVLRQEEKKIRTNPAARVMDLLKEIFARLSPVSPLPRKRMPEFF